MLIRIINMSGSGAFLTSQQAADELGVSLATLYAYASRGLLTSTPEDGGRRHRYAAEDVRALKARRDSLKGGASTASTVAPIAWGAPVLESALCLIVDGALYYRGTNAIRLAQSASLEQTASLLWDCTDLGVFDLGAATTRGESSSDDPIARCLSALAHAAEDDTAAKARTSAARWRTGARILDLMTSAMGGAEMAVPIHRRLAVGWKRDTEAARDAIRQCLVLCAEHELNVSAFTVRCAASTGASLYHAVAAGLCALTGPKHGGATFGAGKLLDDLEQGKAAPAVVREYLDAGLPLIGFGHPLYPKGDPRAKALLEALIETVRPGPVLSGALELIDCVQRDTGLKPSVDFTLALTARVFDLPRLAPLCLFALGRTAGWIGHALEQYQSSALIRPRARYVGPAPKEKI